MTVDTDGRGSGAPSTPDSSSGQHALVLYDTDSQLVELVVAHLAGSLDRDGAAVVFATDMHRALIERGLRERGIDPTASRLLSLDATTLLPVVTAGSSAPTTARWLLEGVIEHAPIDGGSVACFAEMVALLWQQDDPLAVLALEQLWDQLAASARRLDLLCGYPAATFDADQDQAVLAAIQEMHSPIVEAAGGRQLGAETEPVAGRSGVEALGGGGNHPEARRGSRRRRQRSLERIRAANQGLADELRAAQSRTQELKKQNRGLREQIRRLRGRLETREAGGDGGTT